MKPVRQANIVVAVAGLCLALPACGSMTVGIGPVVTAGGASFVNGSASPALSASYPVGQRIERTARYRETKEASRGTHGMEQRGIAFEFADKITGYCISGRGQQGSTAPWPDMEIHVAGRISGHMALISAVEMMQCTLTPLTKRQ